MAKLMVALARERKEGRRHARRRLTRGANVINLARVLSGFVMRPETLFCGPRAGEWPTPNPKLAAPGAAAAQIAATRRANWLLATLDARQGLKLELN